MSLALPVLSIPYPNFDPIAFKIGPLPFRWYGLSYVAGMVLGWLYIRRLVRTPELWGGVSPLTIDHADMLLLWIMSGVVLGGRVIGALLFDLPNYINDPLELVRVWHGGMSFHGGLIGVIIAIILFAGRHKVGVLHVGDVVCAAVPIGLFFGRIANFINGELWGRITNVPWAMVFPNPEAGEFPRHPSQLYEAALEGLLLGLVLWWLVWRGGRLRQPGFVAGAFLAGYGLARCFCEVFREGDDTWFFTSGLVTSGMLYSIPMIFAGAALMWQADPPPFARRSL
jgi:phosphatidylglycerol:prolipoprotein diacylglycerol transferase